MAKKYNIELVNLNSSEWIEAEVKNPMILNKIKIAKEVFSADKIINLPVMKVHYATGVTLALKNVKGFLSCEEKVHFHEVGLDKAIVDLNSVIKIDLNIIDCISCMETMGPRGGDVVELGLLMAGGDTAEIDYIGMKIMGYSLDEVKHLKYYIERNGTVLEDIEVCGEKLLDVTRPFKKVSIKSIVPKKISLHNKNACSSCMNALLLSCSFIETEVKDDVHIYLGALFDNKDISNGLKIAFGNCCKIRNPDVKIKGCPPYPFELKKALS